ncbi:adenosylcobinamide-GDP ribazoletransferase [Marinimicrobium alkaliphilum]|uniref:adenosylcobinamide-GDP ribazoletransferase n=1 Tax=Marinimicrobium alkaliphilum TaxID=2202654 RepID=UPI0013009138|nr:adenosylcobinamide-GDP ribazoletransferase [Marinimicrobium alkaliphilum]
MSSRPPIRHMQAPLLALGLLTRLPVQRWLTASPDAASQGWAVAYYPAIGALLGLLLWVSQWLLTDWLVLDPRLVAVLLLGLWVALTGALHLDGLADVVDGYFAGHKSPDPAQRRERILAVMREPGVGALAVVALVLLLLAKWVALTLLLEAGALSLASWLLLLALPRALPLAYMLSTNYARAQGMASQLKAHLPVRAVLAALVICVLATLGLWPLKLALLLMVMLALLTWAWRTLWQRQIGGFTGDCLGALVELAELWLLLLLAATLGAH